MKLPRPRFGMRFLMVLVAASAVACWAAFIGWPALRGRYNYVRVTTSEPTIGEMLTVEGRFTALAPSSRPGTLVVYLTKPDKSGTRVIYQSGIATITTRLSWDVSYRSELGTIRDPGMYDLEVFGFNQKGLRITIATRKVLISAPEPDRFVARNPRPATSSTRSSEYGEPDSPTAAVEGLVDAVNERHLPKIEHFMTFVDRFEAGADAVAVLVDLMTDGQYGHRELAAYALYLAGPEAEAAIPELHEACSDQSAWVRAQAARALSKVARDREPTVPLLVGLLSDSDGNVRESAARGLGDIGPAARAAVPALTKMVDASTPGSAVRALGMIGPDAAGAVPALAARLARAQDEDRNYVPPELGEALAGIGPAAVPALVRMMNDPDDSVRRRAVVALAYFGPRAESAVPELIDALEDESVRDWAAIVLGRIGPTAKAAVPALVRALGDANAAFRRCAARALGDIGPNAAQAIPQLTKLCADRDQAVSAAATAALEKIQQTKLSTAKHH